MKDKRAVHRPVLHQTRQEIGEEASAVFNNMALQRLTSEADTMLVAPLRFKTVLLEEMDRQIALAMQASPRPSS